ncbi:hypothetical protein [Roseburia sp. 1XD42-69]|uniref:hypothetical protein n=1 Tax=Roseburia sp. 1XD42-69 TaxID=2320088 RepID=UPI000EA019F0|nr:hypothetical protein [Roseburia sp. 1XD42-69]RKJ68112.1 hypothetical protein D7Y06_03435 [Roseburia sp. 1XD42-69]
MIRKLKSLTYFSDAFSEDPSTNEEIKNKYFENIGKIISESLFLFDDYYYRDEIELVKMV